MRIKGKIKHSCGYWLILSKKHPYRTSDGYVFEHRLVMEKKLGRFINPKEEFVHHIDHNKQNNDINNLELLTSSEHRKRDEGWIKRDNKWFKICKRCNRLLEVNTDNFYLRKSGDGEHFYICIRCSKKKGKDNWIRLNGREKQIAYRARKLLEKKGTTT